MYNTTLDLKLLTINHYRNAPNGMFIIGILLFFYLNAYFKANV